MTTANAHTYRTMDHEVAEAVAPGWERRRAEIEEVSAPVREWMLRTLAPEPGQTVLELAWGPPERNPFFSAIAISLVQGGHMPPPDPAAPGLFSMASPQRTRQLLESAGFGEVHTEDVAVTFELASIDEYVEFISDSAGPIAMVLRGLSAADREAVRAQAQAALGRFAAGSGYRIPGVALCAVAA